VQTVVETAEFQKQAKAVWNDAERSLHRLDRRQPGCRRCHSRRGRSTQSYTAEAIVSEGIDKGEFRKVCTNLDCPVHHPKKRAQQGDNAKWKAEQEQQRRETAMANTIGIRTLAAITAAVPVRLMKRDLAFIVESLLPVMDEPRLAMIARNRGVRAKEGESVGRLLAAVLRKADESELGRALVEIVILLSARSQSDSGKVLRTAAQTYKVDTDAIALKVKQEFAAKDKAKKAVKAVGTKQTAKGKRAA
jgi:ParB family transcriptional regulator, chromosome partitioning protein